MIAPVPELRPQPAGPNGRRAHEDYLYPRGGWTPPSLRARLGLRRDGGLNFAPPAHRVPRVHLNSAWTDRVIPINSSPQGRLECRPAGMLDVKGARLHYVDGICHMDRIGDGQYASMSNCPRLSSFSTNCRTCSGALLALALIWISYA